MDREYIRSIETKLAALRGLMDLAEVHEASGESLRQAIAETQQAMVDEVKNLIEGL